jgi:hypothetical protein
MAAAQVGALVREDGPKLLWGQSGKGPGRQHDLVLAAGQAVGVGSVAVNNGDTRLVAGAADTGGYDSGVFAPTAPTAIEL